MDFYMFFELIPLKIEITFFNISSTEKATLLVLLSQGNNRNL